MATVKREDERVTPLELFFDLVFVLALTQCTALMADDPTWAGLAQGLLVLGVLWWAWVGLRLADERRRPRGGGGAARDVRRDGRVAGRRALRARRRSATTRCSFAWPTASCAPRTSCCSSLASRDDPDLRRSVIGLASAPRRGRAARRRVVRRRPAAGRALGRSRCSLDVRRARSSSAPRAGSSCPGTSPSATARSSSSPWASRSSRSASAPSPDVDAGVVVGGGARDRRRRGALVDSTSTSSRSSPRAGSAQARRGPRAQRDGARLLLLPPLPDGGRHRADRARAQEDARRTSAIRCRRAGGGAARRHRALPARPRRASACATSAPLNRQRLVCAVVLIALVPLAVAPAPRSPRSRSSRPCSRR